MQGRIRAFLGLLFFRTFTSANHVGIQPPATEPAASFNLTLPVALPATNPEVVTITPSGQIGYIPFTTRNNAGVVEARNAANTALAPFSASSFSTSGTYTTTAVNFIAAQSDDINGSALRFQNASGVDRWALSKTGQAETGGNAGSNFALYAFTDAGGLITAALTIVRATGYVIANRIGIGSELSSSEIVGTQTVNRTFTLPDRTGSFVVSSSGTTTSLNDQVVERYSLGIDNQTGTTYTVAAADNGLEIWLNNTSAITVTIPAGLPAGFNCLIVQANTGQVTVVAGAGVSVFQRQNFLKTAGRYAVASVIPTPTGDQYILSGDLVA